jgi:hypothetical protein
MARKRQQHSRAPWAAHRDPDGEILYFTDATGLVVLSPTNEGTLAIGPADADLVETAAELLEACRLLLDAAAKSTEVETVGMILARRAIAKADRSIRK